MPSRTRSVRPLWGAPDLHPPCRQHPDVHRPPVVVLKSSVGHLVAGRTQAVGARVRATVARTPRALPAAMDGGRFRRRLAHRGRVLLACRARRLSAASAELAARERAERARDATRLTSPEGTPVRGCKAPARPDTPRGDGPYARPAVGSSSSSLPPTVSPSRSSHANPREHQQFGLFDYNVRIVRLQR